MTDQEQQLEDVLEGRFINRVLQGEAHAIDKAQVTYMQSHGFSNPNWFTERGFSVSDSALNYSQLFKHRFVDMKNISNKMSKHKKKSHPVYNKIFWGHFNNIIRELKYGFTDAIKQEMRQLEK